MIELENVTVHYDLRPILRDVSLQIKVGETVAIMGPNGAGKSTVLRLIVGLMSPALGRVMIDGEERRGSVAGERAMRQKVAYLTDNPWMNRTATVREWISAVGHLYRVDDIRLMDHTERLLDLFHLTEHADVQITKLSNGQRKKTALAGVLATDVPILVLDEPFTGGLDPSGIYALRCVLQELTHRQDVTVVMASQVAELVEQIADRVAVIDDASLAAFDSVEGLKQASEGAANLQDALEMIVSPESAGRVARYLKGASSSNTSRGLES